MTTALTVTTKGRVTLRKELLAHLGIHPGQRLEVEDDPEQARAAMDLLHRADLGEQAGSLG